MERLAGVVGDTRTGLDLGVMGDNAEGGIKPVLA